MPSLPRHVPRRLLTGSAIALLLAALPADSAHAQSPPPNRMPCVNDSLARAFDFWIGDWDVKNSGGTVVGRNIIEKVSGGCALLENWTDSQGGSGKSLNAYNRPLGQWQQFWAGSGGQITEYREGSWHGPSLVYIARPGGTTILRLTFTPVSPDHVRQHGEMSSDSGTTWTTQYDLQYHRRKAGQG